MSWYPASSAAACQSAAPRIVRSSTPMRLHTIGALELWLDRAARERPEALAVNELTYAELDRRATACAHALANARIVPGDRVAAMLGGPGFAVLMHALAKLGAVLVPVNTRLTNAERELVLRDARPRFVLDAAPQSSGDREFRAQA